MGKRNELILFLKKLANAKTLLSVESIINHMSDNVFLLLERQAEVENIDLIDLIAASDNMLDLGISLSKLPRVFLRFELLKRKLNVWQIIYHLECFDIEEYINNFYLNFNYLYNEIDIKENVANLFLECFKSNNDIANYINVIIKDIINEEAEIVDGRKRIFELYCYLIDFDKLRKIFESIPITRVVALDILPVLLGYDYSDNLECLEFIKEYIRKYIKYILSTEDNINFFLAVESLFLNYSLFAYEVVNNAEIFNYIELNNLIDKMQLLENYECEDAMDLTIYEGICLRLLRILPTDIYIRECFKESNSMIQIKSLLKNMRYEKAVFFLRNLNISFEEKNSLLVEYYGDYTNKSIEERIQEIYFFVKKNTLDNNQDLEVISIISSILPDICNMPYDKEFYDSLQKSKFEDYHDIYKKIYVSQLFHQELLIISGSDNLDLTFQDLYECHGHILFDYNLLVLSLNNEIDENLSLEQMKINISHEIRHYIQKDKVNSRVLKCRDLVLPNLMLAFSYILPCDDYDNLSYYQDYSEIDAHLYELYMNYGYHDKYFSPLYLSLVKKEIARDNDIALYENGNKFSQDFVFFKRLKESSTYFLTLLDRFMIIYDNDSILYYQKKYPILKLIFSNNGELYTMEEIEEFRNNPDILLDGSIPFGDEHREDIIRYLYTFYTAYYLRLVKLSRNKELRNKCRVLKV